MLVLLVALIVGAGYAFSRWTDTVAFLAERDGKVAIYRGVPGSVLGLTFSELEETTDINVEDLQPGLANRLRESAITADSVEDAEALVQSYREGIAQSKGMPGESGEEGALS